MIDPLEHAQRVTGRRQSALVDLWSTMGFAAALSEVTGPHVYDYGVLPASTVAITLYDVRRHVLIEDGRVRRDAGVRAGRFRIGPKGRSVLVDAVPAVPSGDLLLLYLGDALLEEIGASRGWAEPVELMDRTWDVDDPFLTLAARRIVEASAGTRAGHPLFAEQLALTLALHVTDRYAAPGRARSGSEEGLGEGLGDGALARVAEFVRAAPGAPVTLGALARVAGVSASCLLRRFKRATGMTPHRFVIAQRVEVARDLLRNTALPLAQVAHQTGFSSQSHFGSTFRAVTGATPAAYRRSTRS